MNEHPKQQAISHMIARKNPEIFIGCTCTLGLIELILSVLKCAWQATHFQIAIDTDGIIEIQDNGVGISFVESPNSSLPYVLEAALTIVELQPDKPRTIAPTKTKWTEPDLADENTAVNGLALANVYSEWMEIRASYKGKEHKVRTERGKIVSHPIKTHMGERTGTTVTFKLDPLIFPNTKIPLFALIERIEGFTCAQGTSFSLIDKRVSPEFKYG